MKKSSYLSERVYDAIPSEINMESLEYWKKILKEEGLQYVKKNHLEYFFGFINNCAFSSHEKSQPRNFVKLSLNKKAFRHEGEKMVFGAFYDPFVQEANRQLSLLIKADFNAVICAVLLLLLIWAMDYLFSLCFKKNDLGISEKKRYIFMAYVGACISGFIIASRDASKMALEIPNITISVLIGAYVPFTLLLEDGKKGKVELQSMKEEWEEKYKKTFRERKVKDILSALLFAMVYGVLLVGALSPAQNIINDIASGIGMGMATVVVAFVGLVEVKNRLTKRRNKREDADQEKSDTE